MPPSSAQARGASAAAIALAAAIAIVSASPRLDLEPNWDATHVYLPMARHLLERGLEFFSAPESVRMTPFAIVYPALLGAREDLVRHVNLWLFGLVTVLAAACAWRSHSSRAAVATAFLVALSPLLRLWFPDAMTEAPYLALTALWLLAVARIATGGGAAWVVTAGVAFGLAVLTRPAGSLFAPLAMAFFAWRARAARHFADRAIDRRLALAHAIGALAWIGWVAHNAWTFHFPAIASGAGTALWHGINPLTDGFDPIYFGLDYDEGSVARDMDHLGIPADRLLAAVARIEIADTPPAQLAGLLWRKALAFLFVTPFDTTGEPLWWLRAWRIVLVAFALLALVDARRNRVVQVAAGFTAYMVAAHLPLLYTMRYSVSAIDLPLSLLAGIGLAHATRDVVRGSATAFAAVLGVALGAVTYGHARPGSPRLGTSPLETLWSADVGLVPVRLERAQRSEPNRFALEPGAALEIAVRDAPRLDPAGRTLATLELGVQPAAGRDAPCDALRLRYRASRDASFAPWRTVRIPLDGDGAMHRLSIGTTVPLRLVEEGVLRLEFECRYAALATIGTIRVSAPRRPEHYRDAYLRTMRAREER